MFEGSIVCERLFFALRPPPALARQMTEAVAVLDCRPLPPERVHMTLFLLDDMPRLVPALVDRLRTVGAAMRGPAVPVTLDRLAGSYRLVALRSGRASPPLAALHRQIAERARAAGIAERADARFSPHVTLGYDNPMPWSERVAPIDWLADELVLIHSRVGRTRHELLGRWPLRGSTASQPTLI